MFHIENELTVLGATLIGWFCPISCTTIVCCGDVELYNYAYVHAHVRVYTQTQTQMQTQTHRQTHRQTDTETDTHNTQSINLCVILQYKQRSNVNYHGQSKP